MSLHNLPNELLLRIGWFVLKCKTCHCHHTSHHLSAFARCSRRLHSALTPDLLSTASALHILLWAITNSRQDTIILAIAHGADPNIPLRETHSLPRSTSHVFLGTPLDISFRLRLRSMDTASHQLHLDTCMTLLHAGGQPSTNSLSTIAESSDEALLRCCLPYIITDAPTLLVPALNGPGRPGLPPLPVLLGMAAEPIIVHSQPTNEVVGRTRCHDIIEVRLHYHGWDLPVDGSWDDWGPWCTTPEVRRGCMCPTCPLERTGGYCAVSAVRE